MPRNIQRISAYLTPNLIHEIIDAIQTEPEKKGKVGKVKRHAHGVRDKLFLRTMWETGGRVSEVSHLIKRNINLRENSITIHNLKQEKRKPLTKVVNEKIVFDLDEKGHKKFNEQITPPTKTQILSEKSTLCTDLIEYCKQNNIVGDDDYVFYGNTNKKKPLNSIYIWKLLCGEKGISRQLGIVRAKRSKGTKERHGESGNRPAWPHTFRHSRAQLILKETGKVEIVKEHMGHANLETTKEYFVVDDEMKKKELGGMTE